MSEGDRIRLKHMRDATAKAVTYAKGRSRADLDSDEMLALSVVRLIEIAGEAAKHISQAVKDRVPQIPWKQIAGARDRLIHGYYDVDMDIVWQIVACDMPTILPMIENLLAEE